MSTESTRAELSAACTELVRLWHTRGAINPDRQLHRYHDARLFSVSALAAHAYRTAEVGDHLIGEGLWLESAPVVRTAYECAITAMWTAQVLDGVEAIINEDYRSKRTMADTMRRAVSWTEAGLSVPDSQNEQHETLSAAQAKSFLQMCDDLSPGGAEAYALYKTMCWFSHPTNFIMNSYGELIPDEDGTESLKLRRTPLDSGEQSVLFQFVCAASMVIASSALNILDADKSHGAQIAEIADRVGVSAEMRLTEKARQRVNPIPGGGA